MLVDLKHDRKMHNTNGSSWHARGQCARLWRAVLALAAFSCARPTGSSLENAVHESGTKLAGRKMPEKMEGAHSLSLPLALSLKINTHI